MSGKPPLIGIGIPWYRRDDYPRILEIMADRQSLPRTFDEWEKRAHEAERHFSSQGQIYRANIDPEKFISWCALRGCKVDAEARMQFSSDPTNWDTGGKH